MGRQLVPWVGVVWSQDWASPTAAVLVVGLVCRPGSVVSWQNWTAAPATGVAILAQVSGGWRWGTGAVAVLGGLYALTAQRDVPVAPGNLVVLLGDVGQLAAFTVVCGLVFTALVTAARGADAATAEVLAVREEQARLRERVRHYELLHTNVLTTLTVVARSDGRVGDELRARCRREVDHLRALVRSAVEPAGAAGLGAALAEVVLAQGALGLRIHHDTADLPADLPREVVAVLAEAVTEALNNVARHAGVDEAWVVAEGQDGGVVVTVTDRGGGFDVATARRGLGLGATLGERVSGVGGRVVLRSRPGAGTSVELAWPGGAA